MKHLLPIVLISLFICSCQKPSGPSDSAIHAKVDSIVGSRMEEINRRAMEDLDQRMTIEVKAKADSILSARRAAETPAAPIQPQR